MHTQIVQWLMNLTTRLTVRLYDDPILFLNTVMKPTKKDLKSKQISFQANFRDYAISRLSWLLEILF